MRFLRSQSARKKFMDKNFWSAKLSVAFSPLALVPLLIGCANSNLDNIYDAQTCLDKSTQATAMTCYAKVNGDSSAAASLIRCASILVYEGFGSASVLQTASSQLTGSSAGNAAAALAFLADKGAFAYSSAADLSKAADAATQCGASGSSGLSFLASLASVATIGSAIGHSGTPSLSDINTNASTIVSTYPQVPSLLTTTYQQNCSGTISSADQSFCTQYAAALTHSSSASAAATYFLQHLN